MWRSGLRPQQQTQCDEYGVEQSVDEDRDDEVAGPLEYRTENDDSADRDRQDGEPERHRYQRFPCEQVIGEA